MNRILKIVIGCLITSVGVIILKHSEVVTGGTAGLSLTLSYIFHAPFALFFFLTNIPFYIFSIARMGWSFTLSTIFSVTMLSLMTGLDHWISAFSIPAFIGAVAGGAIIGFGLSMLFINRASLGGINILALFLQKKNNWNPGTINFIFDFFIVLAGIYSVGLERGMLSILSIGVTSSIISYFKKRIGNSNKINKSPSVKPLRAGQ